jgi:hypothetical protein
MMTATIRSSSSAQRPLTLPRPGSPSDHRPLTGRARAAREGRAPTQAGDGQLYRAPCPGLGAGRRPGSSPAPGGARRGRLRSGCRPRPPPADRAPSPAVRSLRGCPEGFTKRAEPDRAWPWCRSSPVKPPRDATMAIVLSAGRAALASSSRVRGREPGGRAAEDRPLDGRRSWRSPASGPRGGRAAEDRPLDGLPCSTPSDIRGCSTRWQGQALSLSACAQRLPTSEVVAHVGRSRSAGPHRTCSTPSDIRGCSTGCAGKAGPEYVVLNAFRHPRL